jgi:hypothetical protein
MENSQLQIPYPANEDPNSFELLRVWVANGGQHVALRTGVWQDPAAWGIMLNDLMQHIANAYHQNEGLDRARTLERIKSGFDAELASPTDRPTGR